MKTFGIVLNNWNKLQLFVFHLSQPDLKLPAWGIKPATFWSQAHVSVFGLDLAFLHAPYSLFHPVCTVVISSRRGVKQQERKKGKKKTKRKQKERKSRQDSEKTRLFCGFVSEPAFPEE